MNILTVANMYPSDSDPVYGTFVKNFYESVRERNPHGRNDLCTIKGRRMSRCGKLAAYISYYCRLIAALLRSKHDLIYVHTITFPSPAIRFVSLFKKLPVVFNVHGDDVLPSNSLKSKLKDLARPLVVKSMMVVCPSEYFRKVLNKEFPELDNDKIYVSPSGGLNAKFFRTKNIKSLNNRQLLLGFVSRIDSGKGWELFIDLICRLRKEGVDCRAVIAGRGAQSNMLTEYIANSSASEYIEYIGAQDHDKLPELYGNFDLLVFPTYNASESLGLVGLEAMAAGTPVVASDMAGPKGYVKHGENGYLFEPRNLDALTSCIHKYLQLSDEERKHMSEAAYNHSLDFEANKVADELYKQISRLISSKKQ